MIRPLLFCFLLLGGLAVATVLPSFGLDGEVVVVHPKESSTIIANPGMGWQTSDHLRSVKNEPAKIPSQSAYLKYYWYEFEPSDGAFDFSKLRRNLAQAEQSGQRVTFRLMIVDELTSAQKWIRALGVKGYQYRYDDGSGAPGEQLWSPDFNDSLFLIRHARLLKELGKILDSDPRVDYIDIGSVGLWGEWHFSDTSPRVPLPDFEHMQVIIDQYFEAFPHKPKLMQIAEVQSLRYALKKGAGWRADCFGNTGLHMRLLYPANLLAANAADVWKKAPVALETCWTMDTWLKKGLDVDAIFAWGLDQHASLINPKRDEIPEPIRKKGEAFLQRLGYRFVLEEARFAANVKRGATLSIAQSWDNRGVAPCYKDAQLAFQLRDSAGKVLKTELMQQKVIEWLPGKHNFESLVSIPAGGPAGNYTLHVGLVDAMSSQPIIQLAHQGQDALGWLELGTFALE